MNKESIKNKKVLGKASVAALAGVMMLGGGLMFVKDHKSVKNNFSVVATTNDPDGDVIELKQDLWLAQGKLDAMKMEPLKQIANDPTLQNVSNIDLFGYFIVDVPAMEDPDGASPRPSEIFTIENLSADAEEIGTKKLIEESGKSFYRHYYRAKSPITSKSSLTLFDTIKMNDLGAKYIAKLAAESPLKTINIEITAIGVQTTGNTLAADQETIEGYVGQSVS